MRRTATTVALLALLAAALPAHAADPGLPAQWRPIDPARLAQMRGGFQIPGGPLLSFGIERVVFVNGELVAQVAVRIPDVAGITADQAQALAGFQRGLVVQIGEGNHFDPAQLAGGLVVQNTLDNQHIRTTTRIEVGVDTLPLFQELNSNSALTDALVRTPGTP